MRFLFLLLPCLIILTGPSLAQDSIISHIQNAQKSIVEVRTELTKIMHASDGNPTGQVATFTRTGAGLVLDPSGIIVTNTHTIIHAPFIFVILRDGTKLPAQVLFASEAYDFSFLAVTPPHPLQPVSWADSSRAYIGENIVVVGNSDFDDRSIMEGHIKSILQSHSQGTDDFFELDMDLYKGDSGGPVLDTQGRLLGMVMAKRESQQKSSIAIAANKIREQYWQYKQKMP